MRLSLRVAFVLSMVGMVGCVDELVREEPIGIGGDGGEPAAETLNVDPPTTADSNTETTLNHDTCHDACPEPCELNEACCPSRGVCVALDCPSCCPDPDFGFDSILDDVLGY